jgi:3-oxoacyl-[acyl-carrier-protein] synthase-1
VTEAVISATSVICAAGFGAPQVWATVQAGIARITSSNVMDKDLEPIRMGLVPEEALEPDGPVNRSSLPSRARRMLRLAAPALRALADDLGGAPCVLYLGLPELSEAEAPWLEDFAVHLSEVAGVELDADASRTFPFGRAAALMALEAAIAVIADDPTRTIVVGGVDSFLDLMLLATLDAEKRILSDKVMDGFIPGEGAAFLVLASNAPAAGLAPSQITVWAAASSQDAGHRSGSEPARGEGLAEAIATLRTRLNSASTPVATVFSGFNGESFDAKLWGVARMRHGDMFDAAASLEHPADCFGDAGAATGAILAALAATALSKGRRYMSGKLSAAIRDRAASQSQSSH